MSDNPNLDFIIFMVFWLLIAGLLIQWRRAKNKELIDRIDRKSPIDAERLRRHFTGPNFLNYYTSKNSDHEIRVFVEREYRCLGAKVFAAKLIWGLLPVLTIIFLSVIENLFGWSK